MSRYFFLERIRINIEIFCESVGDVIATSSSKLKKPLMLLAGLAMVMTLRAARKGVQKMKMGGLTSGAHEATFKAFGTSSSSAGAFGSGASKSSWSSSGPGLKGATRAMSDGSYGTSSSSAEYGSSSSLTGFGSSSSAFDSSSGTSAFGGSSSTNPFGSSSSNSNLYGSSASSFGSSSGSSTFGSSTSGGFGSAGTLGFGSSSNYLSSSTSGFGSTSGAYSADSRTLSDLIDRHGTALRVLDAHQFKDYGGVHEFYGQVETLQAFEGAGVVEKVLQSPGQNKVLVVDGGGNLNSAIFGKTAATSAKQNGWRGVIVNGAIREAKHVAETSIGCKALGANPNRGKATTGSKGTALTIGGMQIASGMWIYADKDGLAVSDSELTTGGGSAFGSASFGSSLGSTVGSTTIDGTGTSGGGLSSGTNSFGSSTSGGAFSSGSTTFGDSSSGGLSSGAGAATSNPYSIGYTTGDSKGGGPGTYGSGAGAYGATGNTFGSGGDSSLSSTGEELSSFRDSAGLTGATGIGGGSYPYSHASAKGSSNAFESADTKLSIAVFLSLVCWLLVPVELV